MRQAIAIFGALSFLSAVFVGVAWGMVYRLTPEHRRPQTLRWLLVWWIKGMLVPVALWMVLNLGISWSLQPFMPRVQAARNSGGDWFAEYLRVLADGVFVCSSFWTALTLAWTLAKAGRGLEGEPRSDFKALCWTCSLGMLLPAAGVVVLGGMPVIGMAATAMLAPIAGYAPSILRTRRMPPMYARAVAKMKFGKYSEAEWEIIHELEKCEDDFEGWMMLAELYANQFHNMAEAEQTVLEICEHPRTRPSQLSVALHKLADWHLKLAEDPEAARRDLQMICDRLPGTHLAWVAQLRLGQLPETAEELRAQQIPRPIPLPALGDSLDEKPWADESELDHEQAVTAAKACVEKLHHDPNNVPAREKLARLFAERLGQAERGIEQIGLLLNMPDQEEAKRAEWLGMTAAWEIKYRQDLAAGRRILERLLEEFPQSPQALAAQRRIRLMDAELRRKEASARGNIRIIDDELS